MCNRVAGPLWTASVRINSRAVSTFTVDIHVCVECRLLSLMRLDRFDFGAPIDRVLVHCSKPVFSKLGASATVSHGPFYRHGCDSPRTASGPLGGGSAYNSGHYGEPFLRCNQLQNPTVRDHRRTKISRPRYSHRRDRRNGSYWGVVSMRRMSEETSF